MGGKVAIYTGWKCADCEFVHGCIFVQWMIFGDLTVARNLTCRMSFESGTYIDSKNEPTTDHPMKNELKIYPLDKSTAAEGFLEKFLQWMKWYSRAVLTSGDSLTYQPLTLSRRYVLLLDDLPRGRGA